MTHPLPRYLVRNSPPIYEVVCNDGEVIWATPDREQAKMVAATINREMQRFGRIWRDAVSGVTGRLTWSYPKIRAKATHADEEEVQLKLFSE